MNPSDTKEDMKQLRELVMDSFKITAHCFAANIHERKERIKKETHLKPRVKSILAEAKTSPTLLFGDKIKDKMEVLSEKPYALTVESQFSRPRSSHSFLYRKGGGVRTTSTLELPIQDLQRIQQQQLQETSEFQKGTRSKEQSQENLTVSKGILSLRIQKKTSYFRFILTTISINLHLL